MSKNKIIKAVTTVLSTVVVASSLCGCFQKGPDEPQKFTEMLVAPGTDVSSISQEYTTEERDDSNGKEP